MTPTEQSDTKELRRLAEAASKGPWFAADWANDFGSDKTTVEYREPEVLREGQSSIWPSGIACRRVAKTEEGERPLEDAAYIAAVNPAAILALLDRLERAEAAAYCPDCKGSGEGMGMEGFGPDTYEVTITCPSCNGSGERAQAAAVNQSLTTAAAPSAPVAAQAEPVERLTDAQIVKLYCESFSAMVGRLREAPKHVPPTVLAFARSIEAHVLATPSAPVAAPRALVTPDMAGSPCDQCGQRGTHLCAASAAPLAAQAEPVKRILLPEALCKQLLRDYFQRTKNGSERQTPVLRELLHATYAHGRAMAATPPAPMQEAGDALLVELRDWFEAQRKAISKGCGSAWDMAQCAEQIEKINRAIATSKENN